MPEKKEQFAYDILREGEEIILKIDCDTYIRLPSIEDDPLVMAKVVEIIAQTGNVTKIVLSQKRKYTKQ